MSSTYKDKERNFIDLSGHGKIIRPHLYLQLRSKTSSQVVILLTFATENNTFPVVVFSSPIVMFWRNLYFHFQISEEELSFFKILRCQLLLQISLFLQTNSTLCHQVRFGQVVINSKIQFLPNFFLRKVDFALYPYPLDKIAFNCSPQSPGSSCSKAGERYIHWINHHPTNKCQGNHWIVLSTF